MLRQLIRDLSVKSNTSFCKLILNDPGSVKMLIKNSQSSHNFTERMKKIFTKSILTIFINSSFKHSSSDNKVFKHSKDRTTSIHYLMSIHSVTFIRKSSSISKVTDKIFDSITFAVTLQYLCTRNIKKKYSAICIKQK